MVLKRDKINLDFYEINSILKYANLYMEVFMFGLGTQEIILILVVAVVIFGVGKLPQIGDSMGKAIRNFKNAAKDDDAIDITPKKDGEDKDSQNKNS